MAAFFEFDAARNLVSGRIDHLPSFQDAADALSATASDRRFALDATTLWDLRALDFAPVRRDAVASFVRLRARYPSRAQAPMALVVGSTLGFGMCRMFQTMSELAGGVPDGRIGVFYDPVIARDWLEKTHGVRSRI